MSCWSMLCSSSSSSATPMAAASMTSVLPMRPRIPYPHGAGSYRSWASWRFPCPRSRSSCLPRSHATRS
jgi:hypothetical protein